MVLAYAAATNGEAAAAPAAAATNGGSMETDEVLSRMGEGTDQSMLRLPGSWLDF